MDSVVHLRVPAEVIERLDEAAVAELRTRSNMAVRLVDEGLRRRELAAEKEEDY